MKIDGLMNLATEYGHAMVKNAQYKLCSTTQIAEHAARVKLEKALRTALGEPAAMRVGDRYNWRNQSERLIYLGKKGGWHQFKKIDDARAVWCEVLDADLHMIEETTP